MGITYGFEAEFTSGARQLIVALNRAGWSSMDQLHPWHCDRPDRRCDHCSFEGGNRRGFRGQTDSSCDGEIISPVFGLEDTGDDFFTEAATALQENAVEVDAEPGRTAGMHVHVKPQRRQTFPLLLWEFVRWEQAIKILASGPFAEHRQGMNGDVGAYAQTWFEMYGRPSFPRSIREATSNIMVASNRLVGTDDVDALSSIQIQMHEWVAGQDRHSNLAFSQRHNTAELRVWNSTRSAWRMRMFTSVSRLMANPEFLDLLARAELEGEEDRNRGGFRQDTEANLSRFIELAQSVDPQAAELMERQREFLGRNDFARTFTASNGTNGMSPAARRQAERESRLTSQLRANAPTGPSSWDEPVRATRASRPRASRGLR